ncbi:MAG: endonuclease/exonuclease/phosphatase family protein [Schleiferiaceae bacterium]|nr:endonuclease/exonuclease/phosphatase family protein [Schleiferiaceae bacterium]
MFKGLTFFGKIIYLFNIPFAVILLLSYLSAWVNPAQSVWIALLGLFFPVWLLSNFAFVVFWMLNMRRHFLLSFVCILLGWPFLASSYQFKKTKTPETTEKSIRVMSYNVRNFNHQKWLPRTDIKPQIEGLIEREAPDIICFQEYMKFANTPDVPRGYFKDEQFLYNKFGFGMYTKFPVIRSELASFELGTPSVVHKFAVSDLLIFGDTVRVINVHLASIKLEFHKYGFLQNPKEESQEQIKTDIKTIFNRLKTAFVHRGNQMKILKEKIDSSPYPVILCGDVNDPPYSYAAFQLSRRLTDTYRSAGGGFIKTFVSSPFPLRIDYIYHSKNWQSHNYRVIDEAYSDHYPVLVDIALE